MQDGPFLGRELTGGRPRLVNGMAVVKFTETEKGKNICAKYDSRPDLAALVAEYEMPMVAETAVNKALLAEHLAATVAIEAPLLAAMDAEADRLRLTIPAGHIEVTVTQTGDIDGYPILQYTVNAHVIPWQDVQHLGTAYAIRPGAMGAFATRRIASISRERLAEIIASQKSVQEKKEGIHLAETKRIADLTDLARATDQPQIIDRWTTNECSEDLDDCSFDNACCS